MNDNKIGKFIAFKRKEKGLTQQELGDKLYVTDKAVSKWERGISFPDITLLKKLAKELDVSVEDILEGQSVSKKIDIESKIKEVQISIDKSNKRKRKKLIISIVVLSVILLTVVFKNMNAGYTIKEVNYKHSNRSIELGIPKYSFLIKNNDRSYSIKNLRGSNILENEIKRYLKTLKYSNCNDTIYYYNEKDNFSIINYGVRENVLFTTISYEIVDSDYCIVKKMEEYSSKINGLKRFHLLGDGKVDLNGKGNHLEVFFLDGYDEKETISDLYSFKAEMKAMYYKNIENIIKNGKTEMIILEDSIGRFEIKEDKLYYFREKIIESKLKLPEVSVFKLENGKMFLIENYLSKYADKIVLK